MKETTKINISDLVDNSRFGSLQLGIGLLCGACLMIDGFDVQAMGYAAPALIGDWEIARASLGPVFSAALFGILVGSLLFSTIADKIGRRPMLITATLVFSALTFWTAQANTIEQLFLLRFFAGVGLGGIMPNALALIGEYSPSKWRVAVMMVVGNGFNLGAALGGLVAAWLIPAFGWRSVFYFGGALPLVIGIVMIFFLPESLQLMVLRRHNRRKIAKALRRVNPAAPSNEAVEYVAREERREGVPVVHLFTGGRALATILLWAVYFLNLLNLYLLSSWLPTVMNGAGYSTSTAVLVGTSLQAGGAIGCFALAAVIERVGLLPSLTAGFAVASICIGLIGQPGISLGLIFVVVFLAGWGILGGQSTINALAGIYYPTYLRSTGVGWCLGIGRIGAIVGPLFAGEMMRRNLPNQQLFLAAATLAFIATLIMVSLRWVMKPAKAVTPAGQVAIH